MDSRLMRIALKLCNLIPISVISKIAGLRKNLDKASIRVNFEVYVGLMVLTALVTGITVFSLLLIILLLSGNIAVAFALSVLSGLSAAFFSVGMGYVYPLLEISARARKIDANLPLIANFMSVLASSGMPPERIVRSLANVGGEFGVDKEARRIIADIELLGLDLRAALRNASLRSPSKSFASLLDGVFTTSHMGGDLAGYLREEADKYKRARVQTMKGFLENLGTVAEGYISFMIALPLSLVVMLSVMSFIGGGALIVGFDPKVLLALLTFLITPAGVGIMLLLVDSLTPPR